LNEHHLHEVTSSGVEQELLIRKADMIHAHVSQAMISVGSKFLIAAGGWNLKM
jgi:hypothetical protein